MSNSWYTYNGTGSFFNSGNYQKVTIGPACIDGSNICAVLIIGDTAEVPSAAFTNNIVHYIANGLVTLSRKPNGAGQKAYVYMKNL